MSITAAYFLGEQKMVYAAGAPRANGTGQVILFTKIGSPVNLMVVNFVISGEQFASNFGYELATADLNGDEYVVISFFKLIKISDVWAKIASLNLFSYLIYVYTINLRHIIYNSNNLIYIYK